MRKKRSLFDGESYKGYRVSVKLERDGLEDYKPLKINRAKDVYKLLKSIKDSDRERFYSIHLDSRNTLLNCEEVAIGSSSTMTVYPKEIFRSALLSSCNSIIVAHNHPTGDPTPSIQDIQMTNQLCQCGDLFGIDVLDSVVLGHDSYYSFKEAGLMERYKR